MSVINVLPREIFELIAAGEVVERPSSVVKELVENSVDAKATKITVEIRQGGVRYIRITDNGCGIARDDVKKAFISHATSKLKTTEDLESIMTMGFRGEALASVAAVARVEMLTKTPDSQIGTRYVIEGGTEQLLDDAGCPDGTTVIVSDIFYNIPARMKFLKRDVTEGNYVSDIVNKIALAHPEISIRLIKDDRQTLFTSGDAKLQNTIYSVLGKEFSQGLIPCNYSLNGIKVSGFITKPLSCRPNRNMQNFFVNSRYVKLPFAAAALDEAYKNSSMVGRFPGCVLNIEIAAHSVDVNVHPAKTEVRFSEEKKIFEAVYYAAKSALAQGDTRPEVSFRQRPQSLEYSAKQPSAEQFFLHIPAEQVKKSGSVLDLLGSAASHSTQVTYGKGVTYVHTEKRRQDLPIAAQNKAEYTALPKSEAAEKENAPAAKLHCEPLSATAEVRSSTEEQTGLELYSEPQIVTQAEETYTVLGEAFKTYIIVEQGEKLLLFDKHALHERMIFNELKEKVNSVDSQVLLLPKRVSLSRREYSAVLENLDSLENAGFCIEDFADGEILVRECPMLLDSEDVEALLQEMAGELCLNNKLSRPEKLDMLFHTTACKAAIKAGKRLKIEEMQGLIERFMRDDSIRYCPHGRPVMIELTKRELEKQFGRAGAI